MPTVDPLVGPATLTVTPWADPVIDTLGHDPRSPYVERFWLGILGPSHHLAAAPAGGRPRAPARRLRARRSPRPPGASGSAPGAGATRRSCARSPAAASSAWPARRRRRAGRAPQAAAAQPPAGRPPARRRCSEAHQRLAGAASCARRPDDRDRRRARRLALSLLELGEDVEAHRAPAPPLALPPGSRPRGRRLGPRAATARPLAAAAEQASRRRRRRLTATLEAIAGVSRAVASRVELSAGRLLPVGQELERAGGRRSRCRPWAARRRPRRARRGRRCRGGPTGCRRRRTRAGTAPAVERAAVAAAADVLEVGDVGVEAACGRSSGSGSGHTALAGRVGRRPHLVDPARRGCPSARRCGRPRATMHGAGERGEVDDGVGPVLAGQRQGVGEDQAALGVGVEHLDGLAVADA